MPRKLRIAVTQGDPTGIGPEIVGKAVGDRRVQAACDVVVMRQKAHGVPGRIAMETVQDAVQMARDGEADAVVTAPISKAALAKAGLPWRDHTEFLAETFRAKPSMMLVTPKLRVLHATGHVSIREAHARVTAELVWEKLHLLDAMLRRMGFRHPRIGVAGLNPHAGEGGVIGHEERWISLVLAHTRRRIRAIGPIAPDVVFRQAAEGRYDGVLCFLHDHGHIAVKMISGFEAVQVSAGLPIVRTSPAHGTAPDIAGKGIANPEGMIQAILLAAKLARNWGGAPRIPPMPRLAAPRVSVLRGRRGRR